MSSTGSLSDTSPSQNNYSYMSTGGEGGGFMSSNNSESSVLRRGNSEEGRVNQSTKLIKSIELMESI